MASAGNPESSTTEWALTLSPQISVTLANFVSAVTGASSEDAIFATLASSLDTLVPNDRTSVTLVNSCGDQLDIYSLHGIQGTLSVGMSLPFANTITGQAVEKRQGGICRLDVNSKTLDGQVLYKEGMRSTLSVPLIVSGKSIGAINAASADPAGFNESSLQLLSLVSRLVSANLERQRLLEERKKSEAQYRYYAMQLETLNLYAQRLSTVMSVEEALNKSSDAILSIIPAQRISFALYVAETDSFEITLLYGEDVLKTSNLAAAGTGLERVLKEQQTVYFSDLSQSSRIEQRRFSKQGLNTAWSLPVRIEGEVVAVLNTAATETRDDGGKLVEVLEALSSILGSTLERLKLQEQLIYQVNHDTVTDLPNRRLLYRKMNRLIGSDTEQKFAVLFIDLDRFKVVNDTFGHQVGDELLRIVGKRIKHVIREEDIVARIGGDEFIVLIKENAASGRSSSTAQRIIHSISKSFKVRENSVHIGASIGICISSGGACNAQEMIKAADMAMYKAKAAGRNTYRVCNSTID